MVLDLTEDYRHYNYNHVQHRYGKILNAMGLKEWNTEVCPFYLSKYL